jgi:hypothetical protein
MDGVGFLVDNADYLMNVLDEDDCRFRMMSHGNRTAIKRVTDSSRGFEPSTSDTTHAKRNSTSDIGSQSIRERMY